MDTEKTNRVTMFKTVAAYLDKFHSVWSAMEPLAAAVQQLKDNTSAIDHTAQKQETPTKGAVGDKLSARDTLEDVLFLTCEALGVLGSLSNDHDLVALVNLSSSDLHHLAEEELANRATTIVEKANARKTELATLHVTQANLDELNQALAAYKAAKERPRTAVAERAAQTQSLPSRIRDINNILRTQIDPMVNLFRRLDPEFVAGYRSARVIVDRAASHKQTKTAGSTPPPTPQS